MKDKITEDHLRRPAYVYVRQSTMFQVQHNLESQRRQYALMERAKQLGWIQVEVIDEDLGCSGSGSVVRKGFERLVASVCLGEVGAVLSLEASRLARNNRDWHQLVDLCSLTATLLIDHDGIYDPRHLNDRLLLGLKGTMSEFELGLFRQRSVEALKAKARRGELYYTVPIGYLRVGDDRCEKDPDRRIQHALRTVFEKFGEMGSARQVLLWCRQENFLLPCVKYGPQGRHVEWRLPVYNTVHNLLSNPIYAGAYAFGRRTTKTEVVDGRARKRDGVPLAQEQWMVLLREHHEGYIPWDQHQRNVARMHDNANMKGLMRAKGAARSGRSLLAGLLRCARCGRKLHVTYGGRERSPRYDCRGAAINHGVATDCMSFAGRKIDEAVERKVLEVVEPAAIDAAILAAKESAAEQEQRRKAKELAIEQARFEADRAWRQFNAVDPENRIVAAELERRWNEALGRVEVAERHLATTVASGQAVPVDRDRLMELAKNLPGVWFDERTDMALKKRIVRVLIEEVVVDDKTPGQIDAVIHWKGGQHGAIRVRRNRTGVHCFTTDTDTVELVKSLAEVMSDRDIARQLNRLGRKTGHGNSWNQSRVSSLRNSHEIPVYDPRTKREKGLVNMQEAARHLGVSAMSVVRLIRRGILSARQVMPYAPRLILIDDLGKPAVRTAVDDLQRRVKRPLPEDERQKVFDLQ